MTEFASEIPVSAKRTLLAPFFELFLKIAAGPGNSALEPIPLLPKVLNAEIPKDAFVVRRFLTCEPEHSWVGTIGENRA
jgi:hypothetical protein